MCRYRGRVGTGLSVLWVAYATHSTLKMKNMKKKWALERPSGLGDVQFLTYWQALLVPSSG
jgi:hypothetical protein